MVQFYSDYNDSMSRYEQKCREANASDSNWRQQRRQEIEDELVEAGLSAINEYIEKLDQQWKEAGCLAEYDGLRIAYGIGNRAKARVELYEQNTVED